MSLRNIIPLLCVKDGHDLPSNYLEAKMTIIPRGTYTFTVAIYKQPAFFDAIPAPGVKHWLLRQLGKRIRRWRWCGYQSPVFDRINFDIEEIRIHECFDGIMIGYGPKTNTLVRWDEE